MIITINNELNIEVEQNGTCYIADNKPEFPDGVLSVTINNGAVIETIENAEVVECYSPDGRYWFSLYRLTANDLYKIQLNDERDMVLDLIADQEYRLCLIELGII